MALLRWPHSSRKILPNGLSEALKPGHEKADENPFAAHSHFAKRPILEKPFNPVENGEIKRRDSLFANEAVILQQNEGYLQLLRHPNVRFSQAMNAKTQGFP